MPFAVRARATPRVALVIDGPERRRGDVAVTAPPHVSDVNSHPGNRITGDPGPPACVLDARCVAVAPGEATGLLHPVASG